MFYVYGYTEKLSVFTSVSLSDLDKSLQDDTYKVIVLAPSYFLSDLSGKRTQPPHLLLAPVHLW